MGIIVFNLIVFFLPIYKRVSGDEVIKIYLYTADYTGGIGIISLVLLSFTAVCVFAEFKNKELVVAGLGVSYFLAYFFSAVSLKKNLNNANSSYYTYTFEFGYYFWWIGLILFILSIVIWVVISLLIKNIKENKTSNEGKVLISQTSENLTELDLIKQRITTLNELKDEGVLTEQEYNQKRIEIIKDLKI